MTCIAGKNTFICRCPVHLIQPVFLTIIYHRVSFVVQLLTTNRVLHILLLDLPFVLCLCVAALHFFFLHFKIADYCGCKNFVIVQSNWLILCLLSHDVSQIILIFLSIWDQEDFEHWQIFLRLKFNRSLYFSYKIYKSGMVNIHCFPEVHIQIQISLWVSFI